MVAPVRVEVVIVNRTIPMMAESTDAMRMLILAVDSCEAVGKAELAMNSDMVNPMPASQLAANN